jgi:hypothetical protein
VPPHSIRLAGPWYLTQPDPAQPAPTEPHSVPPLAPHPIPPLPPDLASPERYDLPLPLEPGVPLRAQRFFQRPIRLDPRERVRIRLACTLPPDRLFLDDLPLEVTPLPTGYLAPLPHGLTGRHLLTIDFTPPLKPPLAPSAETPGPALLGVWLEFLGVDGEASP